MLELFKIILLVMDIIIGVIGFFANWYLLYVFASVDDPHVLQRDYYLHSAFYYIFLGFHFLAGLVMMCLLDGFKYLIKCNENTKDLFEMIFNLVWCIFVNFLIILVFGYFAQVIYKFKEITRED